MNKLPELTREILSRSRVIAKGRAIREVKRLVSDYGGKVSQWVKMSSPAVEVGGNECEYHWYEHHGVGRFELKIKRVNDL